MVAQWLVLLPPSKKVLGLFPGPFGVEFAHSHPVWVSTGDFPPTVKKRAGQADWLV